VRVFGPSAVGSLGARWFWRLGGRLSADSLGSFLFFSQMAVFLIR
jgi:hypothetical protein